MYSAGGGSRRRSGHRSHIKCSHRISRAPQNCDQYEGTSFPTFLQNLKIFDKFSTLVKLCLFDQTGYFLSSNAQNLPEDEHFKMVYDNGVRMFVSEDETSRIQVRVSIHIAYKFRQFYKTSFFLDFHIPTS